MPCLQMTTFEAFWITCQNTTPYSLRVRLKRWRLLVFFERGRPYSSWISHRNMEWFKSQPTPHYEVFWSVSLKRNCKAFCCSKWYEGWNVRRQVPQIEGNYCKAEVDYLDDKMRLTTWKVLKMIRVNEMSLSRGGSRGGVEGVATPPLKIFFGYFAWE